MNTKKKFDIMNYFNVIRTVIAMVIALLIVFAPVIARTTRRWPKVQKAASTGKEV